MKKIRIPELIGYVFNASAVNRTHGFISLSIKKCDILVYEVRIAWDDWTADFIPEGGMSILGNEITDAYWYIDSVACNSDFMQWSGIVIETKRNKYHITFNGKEEGDYLTLGLYVKVTKDAYTTEHQRNRSLSVIAELNKAEPKGFDYANQYCFGFRLAQKLYCETSGSFSFEMPFVDGYYQIEKSTNEQGFRLKFLSEVEVNHLKTQGFTEYKENL